MTARSMDFTACPATYTLVIPAYTHRMRTQPALHERVADNVTCLTALLVRLEDELPEKKRNPHGGFGSGKGGHGPLAAWNTQAAMLVLEVHAGARELETNLRYSLTGALRNRGGSSRNTEVSLQNLVTLSAGADYAAVMVVIKKLDQWVWRGRIILGDAEPMARLPRLPGEADPACPYCRSSGTLRVRHSTGVVICLRPGCRDSEGNRTAGRVEVGTFSGEPSIVWADGMTGVQTGAA